MPHVACFTLIFCDDTYFPAAGGARRHIHLFTEVPDAGYDGFLPFIQLQFILNVSQHFSSSATAVMLL
jgi:hypothetical protein